MSQTWEQETLQIIRTLEADKLDLERRVHVAEVNLMDNGMLLQQWYRVLDDYRQRNGLPSDGPDLIPAIETQYARLGPTEMVLLWANTHGGHVILKQLAATVLKAGAYKEYRTAYNTLRSTVRRRKDFENIAPGQFRSRRNAQGELAD